MSTYEQLGQKIGALTDEKNAAYGSSFKVCGDYLRLLYPHGVQPEQYIDLLLLARDFDKSMRIATDRDAFGESPYQDKAGYALLGAQLHAERNIQKCGSVDGQVAANNSTEPNTSAASSAKPQTTETAAERNEPRTPPPSNEPSPSTSASTVVLVQTAQEAALENEAALARSENLQLAFWSKVDKTGKCWMWTGTIHSEGYGIVSDWALLDKSFVLAHRLSWELHYGQPIPKGLVLLHTCWVKACVNPDHLVAGTRRQNVNHMIQHGKLKGPKNISGSRNSRAKLNESQVADIRKRFETITVTKESLAKEFGVSDTTIGRIIAGQSWSHTR